MNKTQKYLIVSSLTIIMAISILPRLGMAQQTTASAIQAQINALMQQVAQLQNQLTQVQGGTTQWCHTFNTNLKVGDTSSEVAALQTALNKEGFNVGTVGKDVVIFDETIAAAVSGFQQKYASEILTPLGLQYGTGYVGAATRQKLNSLYGCGTTPQPTCQTFVTCLNGYNQVYSGIDNNGCPIYKCVPLTTATSTLPVNCPQTQIYCGTGQTISCTTGSNGCPSCSCVSATSTSTITLDSIAKNVVISGIQPLFPINVGNAAGQTIGIFKIQNNNSFPVYFTAAWLTNSGATASSITYNLYASAIGGPVTDTSINYGTVSGSGSSIPFGFVTSVAESDRRIDGGYWRYITVKTANTSCNNDTFTLSFSPGNPQFVVKESDAGLDLNGNRVIIGSVAFSNNSSVALATVTAKDGGCTQPSITVLSPNGGESWAVGSTQTIRWNPVSNYNYVLVDLVKGVNNAFVKSISVGNLMSTGQLTWQVPSDITAGSDYKIYINASNNVGSYGTVSDSSDAPFSIVAATNTSWPGFYMPTDKRSYYISDTVVLALSRADGRQDSYPVDLYVAKAGQNNNILIQSGLQVGQNTVKNIVLSNWPIFQTGGAGDYILNVCAAGQYCPGPSTSNPNSNAVSFTLMATISSISPNQGGANTNITIYGTSLNGASAVWFYNSSGQYVGSLTPSYISPDGTSLTFTISGLFAANVSSGTYQIKVATPAGTTNGQNFTLTTTNSAPSITVLSPNGGESWQIGQVYEVKWRVNGTPSSDWSSTVPGYYDAIVKLYKGSNFVGYISTGHSGPNSIAWNTNYIWDPAVGAIYNTLIPGNDYYVRVSARGYNGELSIFDASDAPFSVVAAPIAACAYSLSSQSQTFTKDAGSGSVNVTITSGTNCSWTASTNSASWDWIGISSGYSGTANGTVNYFLLANNTASARTGTLNIAGQTFTINQQATVTTNSITFSRTPLTSTPYPFKAGDSTTATLQFSPWSYFQGKDWTFKSKTTDTITGTVVNDADFTAGWSDIYSQNFCNSNGYCSLTGAWEASQFSCSNNVNNIRKREEWTVANGVESNHNTFYFKCSNATASNPGNYDSMASALDSIQAALNQLGQSIKQLGQ